MTTLNRPWPFHTHAASLLLAVLAAGLMAAAPGHAAESPTDSDKSTYDQESVLKDAEQFFGSSTEGLARIIEKAFKEHGRPGLAWECGPVRALATCTTRERRLISRSD